MRARIVYLIGLTAALAACAKSSTTTDGMPAPSSRDTMSTRRVDTTQVKPDTLRMPGDSMRRDTTRSPTGQ